METFKNIRISFKADGEEFRFNGGPNIGPLPASGVYTKDDNRAVVPFNFSHKERLYCVKDVDRDCFNGFVDCYKERFGIEEEA